MLYPLKTDPYFAYRIWGGRTLKERYDKPIPDGPIGESWEVSDHPDGLCKIANGEYAGLTLSQCAEKAGRMELFGTEGKFPLLIKILDARDILSVQVHPTDEYAHRVEGEEGKTEAWVVLHAQPGAKMVYGVKEGVTPEEFRAAMDNGTVGDCLNWLEVKAGDVFNIPSGMVHALGAGLLVYEVQQNSNAVYRVFDWNRLENGKPRALHKDKAMDVIRWDNWGLAAGAAGLVLSEENGTRKLMVVNDYFALEQVQVKGCQQMDQKGMRLFTAVNGEGCLVYGGEEYPVAAGDSYLIPAALGQVAMKGEMEALIAYAPDKETFKGYTDAQAAQVPGLTDYLARS